MTQTDPFAAVPENVPHITGDQVEAAFTAIYRHAPRHAWKDLVNALGLGNEVREPPQNSVGVRNRRSHRGH